MCIINYLKYQFSIGIQTYMYVHLYIRYICFFFLCSYAIPCVQKVLECKKVSNDTMKKKMFMGV